MALPNLPLNIEGVSEERIEAFVSAMDAAREQLDLRMGDSLLTLIVLLIGHIDEAEPEIREGLRRAVLKAVVSGSGAPVAAWMRQKQGARCTEPPQETRDA